VDSAKGLAPLAIAQGRQSGEGTPSPRAVPWSEVDGSPVASADNAECSTVYPINQPYYFTLSLPPSPSLSALTSEPRESPCGTPHKVYRSTVTASTPY